MITRNYDSLDNKKSPKNKCIFKSLSLSDTNTKMHNKIDNLKTIFNLPLISKPDCYFSNKKSKLLKKNKINLLNSKSMSLFNIYTNLLFEI